MHPAPSTVDVVYARDNNVEVRQNERKWARTLYREFHPTPARGAFEGWLEYVTGIGVKLHPGGRAVAEHPDAGVPVEVRWRPEGVTAFKVQAVPGSTLPSVEIPMSAYIAAVGLARGLAGPRNHLLAGTIKSASTLSGPLTVRKAPKPPEAGKPASYEFYRDLVTRYDALVSTGDRSPLNTLAAQYGKKRETVKSWLHRGREYLKRKGSGEKGRDDHAT
jgi:hypothetical protein